MESVGLLIGIAAVASIIATAVYSRRNYEELVKLNEKIDALIDRKGL